MTMWSWLKVVGKFLVKWGPSAVSVAGDVIAAKKKGDK
jgi:hypothetical protein